MNGAGLSEFGPAERMTARSAKLYYVAKIKGKKVADPDERRRTAAERVRKSRQRRAAGRLVLQIEVDEFLTSETLIESGHLKEWDAGDRLKIQEGLERFIAALTRYGSGNSDVI